MIWTNEKPWQGIGIDVSSKLSAREMLSKAKIDRQVSKNKRLKSIENEKAFRFFKSFAEAGDANIETIGSLENERIVFALARLNENFIVGDGDELGRLPSTDLPPGKQRIDSDPVPSDQAGLLQHIPNRHQSQDHFQKHLPDFLEVCTGHGKKIPRGHSFWSDSNFKLRIRRPPPDK